MHWFVYRLTRDSQRGLGLRNCKRCGLGYGRELDACPHCADIGDTELARHLEKRRAQRLRMGGIMFLALAVVICVMLLAAFRL